MMTGGLLGAIARERQIQYDPDGYKEAHLDTLASILMRHAPFDYDRNQRCEADGNDWPCPDVKLAVGALTRMGVDA